MTQEINYHHVHKQEEPRSEEEHRVCFESLAAENISRHILLASKKASSLFYLIICI